MEVKINKEIRDYEEQMFLGMSLRQLCFLAAAVIMSACSYFIFSGILGREITSWLCISVSMIPVFAGFFRYEGMRGDRLVFYLIRSMLLRNRVMVYEDCPVFMKWIREKEKRGKHR